MSSIEKEIKELKLLIDDFAIKGGAENRIIALKDSIFMIGGIDYTYDEAVAYLQKTRRGRDINWLMDEVCLQLNNDLDTKIRLDVASYNDEYYKQLKDDPYLWVRPILTEHNDKYHE